MAERLDQHDGEKKQRFDVGYRRGYIFGLLAAADQVVRKRLSRGKDKPRNREELKRIETAKM